MRQDCFVRCSIVFTPPTRQFCLVLTQFRWVLSRLDPVSNLQLLACSHRRHCLVLSAVVFTPPTRTRQDIFVLSGSAMWTQLETWQNYLVLSRWWCEDKTRQDSFVCSPIVFTLPMRTRQDSFVSSASAVWTSHYLSHMRSKGSCLRKEITQDTLPERTMRGRPKTSCMDNIKTWTELETGMLLRAADDRLQWRLVVRGVANPQIEDTWQQGKACQF